MACSGASDNPNGTVLSLGENPPGHRAHSKLQGNRAAKQGTRRKGSKRSERYRYDASSKPSLEEALNVVNIKRGILLEEESIASVLHCLFGHMVWKAYLHDGARVGRADVRLNVYQKTRSQSNMTNPLISLGGSYGNRTHDQRIKSPLLYRTELTTPRFWRTVF